MTCPSGALAKRGCRRLLLRLATALAVLPAGAAPAWAQAGADLASELQELGGGRYRLGSIEIDRTARSFVVPGRVLGHDRPDMPMEFLAGTKGGYKNYEGIVELDTDAIRFNLACLFIGLDPANGRQPATHFDPQPVPGDPVTVHLSWTEGGEVRRIRAEEALTQRGQPSDRHEWVYTGSLMNPRGEYLADVAGTLIGFVHDVSSVIHHRGGLGVGGYGSVIGNDEVLPPPGSPIVLEIARPPAAAADD